MRKRPPVIDLVERPRSTIDELAQEGFIPGTPQTVWVPAELEEGPDLTEAANHGSLGSDPQQRNAPARLHPPGADLRKAVSQMPDPNTDRSVETLLAALRDPHISAEDRRRFTKGVLVAVQGKFSDALATLDRLIDAHRKA